MTIGTSLGHPLFHFNRVDILCPKIVHSCEKLWPFKFLESVRCSILRVVVYYAPESVIRVKNYDHLYFSRAYGVKFRVSRYIMLLNQTSMWKVVTIGISRGRPLFNFERLDILCLRVVHSSEKLWAFEFLDRFRCSISSVSIYYAPESDILAKSYDHLNFSRAYIFQFRASRYIMSQSRTFEWKVRIIWISREVLLFNFERLDILCAWIGHPCEKLWPFEFLEGIRFSISWVSIYYVSKSDIYLKT